MTKVMLGFMTFASCDELRQILMIKVLNFKLSDSITTYRQRVQTKAPVFVFNSMRSPLLLKCFQKNELLGGSRDCQ